MAFMSMFGVGIAAPPLVFFICFADIRLAGFLVAAILFPFRRQARRWFIRLRGVLLSVIIQMTHLTQMISISRLTMAQGFLIGQPCAEAFYGYGSSAIFLVRLMQLEASCHE